MVGEHVWTTEITPQLTTPFPITKHTMLAREAVSLIAAPLERRERARASHGFLATRASSNNSDNKVHQDHRSSVRRRLKQLLTIIALACAVVASLLSLS